MHQATCRAYQLHVCGRLGCTTRPAQAAPEPAWLLHLHDTMLVTIMCPGFLAALTADMTCVSAAFASEGLTECVQAWVMVSYCLSDTHQEHTHTHLVEVEDKV